jgi:hypothetical protein
MASQSLTLGAAALGAAAMAIFISRSKACAKISTLVGVTKVRKKFSRTFSFSPFLILIVNPRSNPLLFAAH